MTISDYASLIVDAGEYSGNDKFVHVAPRLLGLAELKLNRGLRVADMESSTTLTLSNGNASLPPDFLEAREVKTSANVPIRSVSLQQLTSSYAGNSGTPTGYAIVGSTLKARPISDQTLTLSYYAKIPALTPAAPTNWLLTKAPDVYLFALVNEIGIWAKDVAAAAAAQQFLMLALSGINIGDERSRWGNAQVVVGGLTP
ncbi:hypothetical protein GHK46_26430 [Sinorhizobium medicae]|uniref:phage adaptor protein n=1 Tax=Sinorhizobium medicae TaxID=110321 RepID=UPI001295C3A6|nr:hypothetical protein [Sinorhizobium medicae]MQW00727.1 hypothetical protein [Sinorhizobium medicae]